MTKTDKIRRMLAKGYDPAVIARKLRVSKALVYGVRARDSKKAVLTTLATGKVKGVKKEKKQQVTERDFKQQKWVEIVYPGEALIPNAVSVDPVNHPPHYKAGGIETIDFIEAKDFNYRLGNVVKYLSRAGKKAGSDPVQDLEKAAWYLNREIAVRKNA